jgi:hypothetical protein
MSKNFLPNIFKKNMSNKLTQGKNMKKEKEKKKERYYGVYIWCVQCNNAIKRSFPTQSFASFSGKNEGVV